MPKGIVSISCYTAQNFSNKFLTKLEKVVLDLYKFLIVYVTIKTSKIVWNNRVLRTEIMGLKSIIHH